MTKWTLFCLVKLKVSKTYRVDKPTIQRVHPSREERYGTYYQGCKN